MRRRDGGAGREWEGKDGEEEEEEEEEGEPERARHCLEAVW